MVIRTQAGAHTPPKVALLGLARSAGKLVYSISKFPFPASMQLRQRVFPPEELILAAGRCVLGKVTCPEADLSKKGQLGRVFSQQSQVICVLSHQPLMVGASSHVCKPTRSL